ncbi:MAG: FUSC family protein [Oscillospiraceae bacterium]|nr:FUSC family protein [Oscillospiraceae bacterium]
MREQQNAHRIEPMDIQIGVTIVLCFLLCHAANIVGIPIEALGVTTGAIMCVQDSTKAAYKTSLTRILGVVFGGVFGVAITLIDNALGMPYVFYLLCGLGVIVNLVVCKLFKMIYVQARVSCLTLLLVVLVSQGADRLTYAVNRFIGSLVGALIALIVTIVCARIVNQKNKNHT